MPENLIGPRTPWKLRNADPGFGYAGGFQNILTAYNGLNHRGADVRYHDNQVLFQEQIDRLIKLKDELERDERNFFIMFGLGNENTDKKECFRQLKQKIIAWNGTGADALLNDKNSEEFWQLLSQLQRDAAFAEMPDAIWNETLTNVLNDPNTPDLTTLIKNNANIAEILNSVFDKKKGYATKGKSTLLTSVKVSLDKNNNNKIVLTVDHGSLSTQARMKVVKDLEKHLGERVRISKPNYNIAQVFTTFFNEQGITADAQISIKLALNNFANVLDQYAFNSDQKQIKGFMGEVYNNAFLYYMANNNEGAKENLIKITPTGAMREVGGTRPEIMIDTWLRGFGIQVKNYEHGKIMSKGFTKQKSYSASTFIQDVLQLPLAGSGNTASVGDILLNFFTAYDYNQDYTDTEPQLKETEGYQYWRQARNRMDSKFADSNALTNILIPYIDKIVGVDRAFTSGQMFIPDENHQYFRNAFFNISGEYIPSSAIIQAIIDQLNKKKTDSLADMVTATFSATHSGSGPEQWNPYISNNMVTQVYDDRFNYAKNTTIRYNLTIDVARLVEQIYPK